MFLPFEAVAKILRIGLTIKVIVEERLLDKKSSVQVSKCVKRIYEKMPLLPHS